MTCHRCLAKVSRETAEQTGGVCFVCDLVADRLKLAADAVRHFSTEELRRIVEGGFELRLSLVWMAYVSREVRSAMLKAPTDLLDFTRRMFNLPPPAPDSKG